MTSNTRRAAAPALPHALDLLAPDPGMRVTVQAVRVGEDGACEPLHVPSEAGGTPSHTREAADRFAIYLIASGADGVPVNDAAPLAAFVSFKDALQYAEGAHGRIDPHGEASLAGNVFSLTCARATMEDGRQLYLGRESRTGAVRWVQRASEAMVYGPSAGPADPWLPDDPARHLGGRPVEYVQLAEALADDRPRSMREGPVQLRVPLPRIYAQTRNPGFGDRPFYGALDIDHSLFVQIDALHGLCIRERCEVSVKCRDAVAYWGPSEDLFGHDFQDVKLIVDSWGVRFVAETMADAGQSSHRIETIPVGVDALKDSFAAHFGAADRGQPLVLGGASGDELDEILAGIREDEGEEPGPAGARLEMPR